MIRTALACLPLLVASVPASAGTPTIELKVGREEYRGTVYHRNDRYCWLLQRDGRLQEVDLKRVTGFRKVASSFRPVPVSVLKDRLQQDYGRDYEVTSTREYVVVGPRGRTREYARLLDETYRSFLLFFRVRKFDVPRPSVPLVAIVFREPGEFADFLRKEGVHNPGYLGIYLGRSNRLALFEPSRSARNANDLGPSFATRSAPEVIAFPRSGASAAGLFEVAAAPVRHGSLQSELQETLIHEATHQLAYNCGIHNRIGWNPKWVVEGLATLFEAPGVRDRSRHRSRNARLNIGRLGAFQDYVARRRSEGSLAKLVSSDRRFRTAIGDAYAESWALTYFLVETRPRKFWKFLQHVANRNPTDEYSAEERLQDFQKFFGRDVDRLEAEFLRFTERID